LTATARRRRWKLTTRTRFPILCGDLHMTIEITTPRLGFEERCVFEEMIDASIIARYDSELERHDTCDRKGVFDGYFYTPVDTDCIRKLLETLWGNLLSAEAVEDAFIRLTKDGAAEWPEGYCEEDDEEDRLAQLDQEDQEAAAKEEHEKHLR
jgi:hypothetical protein